MSEALKTGVALGIEQRAIDQQIAALSANLQQIRTGQRSTMRVAVPLDTPQATKLTLKISYQLPGATWRPVYDARVDTKTAKLALTEFGEVTQSTGEDWKNVALVLSTAEPAVGAAAPKIEPELVDLQQEYRKKDYQNGVGVTGSSMNRLSDEGEGASEPVFDGKQMQPLLCPQAYSRNLPIRRDRYRRLRQRI